ncbi:hypothetical protein [Pseudaestuariivita rosea]|uniref:hypothetical protein n=1 Tax=Pseudaestuariivita rosea TaxID=2763263 RepID=UPI001ABB3524|nr:hypothetical protein [Pseudaestuariivita rosea]
MPSPSKPRLCVFGDSHYAAVKRAVDEQLVDTSGVDLEFWGHAGNRFRFLEWKDDCIRPIDDFTAKRFAKFNEKQRRFLDPRDFDAIVFVGSRLRTTRVFALLLDARLSDDKFLSQQLEHEIVRHHLEGELTYHFARNIAALNVRVLFSPVSFDIKSTPNDAADVYAKALAAKETDRRGVWKIVAHEMGQDGIELIPQRAVTVTDGCFTKAKYATDRYVERNDYTHKNAAYGALVFQDVLKVLKVDQDQISKSA